MRAICARFATGVTVVTAVTPDGRHIGVTMNSFSSVSLDPPLVSLCLGTHLLSRGDLLGAERFNITILRQDQEQVSRHFARSGAKSWDEIRFRRSADGPRIIEPCVAALECRTFQTVEAGDHVLLLGRVLAVHAAPEGAPLLFYNGAYADLARRS